VVLTTLLISNENIADVYRFDIQQTSVTDEHADKIELSLSSSSVQQMNVTFT